MGTAGLSGRSDLGARRQQELAAVRVAERDADRRRSEEVLETSGGMMRADTPRRVAARVARVGRHLAGEDPDAGAPAPATDSDAEVEREIDRMAGALGPLRPDIGREPPGVILESVIGTADFLDVRYLDRGAAAARAVGRVLIGGADGDGEGFGTGFMVTPRLLLTNHHVLESAETAAGSAVEFDFQLGLDGAPMASTVLRLEPGDFFVADEERDFALVAVRPGPDGAPAFGVNRLIRAEGKAIIGESVSIVQHPGGGRKQIALRENVVIDLVDAFIHYETDTEPGSSGSPVFNDQWEVVALHHASVPLEDGRRVNEGIRISRLVARLAEQDLPAPWRALADEILRPESRAPSAAARAGGAGGRVGLLRMDGPAERGDDPPPSRRAEPPAAPPADAREARMVIPLEVIVRLGAAPADPASVTRVSLPSASAQAPERIEIDPDYASRRGYDPAFLAGWEIPIPALGPASAALAAVSTTDPTSGHVLHYHHYSVVMNRRRRIAFLTVVNVDGRTATRVRRERDRWVADPRIAADEQTDEALYRANALDRGHLVRRLDPAWGATAAEAKRAADDTFHFTNASPQHADFNQRQTAWAGLEDYVLENADNRDLTVSVFTGPVFADDDDLYRGILLPRQFWKVVAMVRSDGTRSATAYLLSQAALLADLEAVEEFSYGAYRTFQVPVARVALLADLDMAVLEAADPLAGLEATRAREVRGPDDLIL